METMITQATHEISNFVYIIMSLTMVICATLFVASIIFPEWKPMAIKGIITVIISGLILSFGSNFISWIQGFNSF